MESRSQARVPVSVTVSLSDHSALSTLLSTIRGAIGERADSVRVSIRGDRSAVVDILKNASPGVDVSAAFSIKGSSAATTS
jgi:hypothetical protein